MFYYPLVPRNANSFVKDTLRRRFTACLRWYYALLDAAENHLQDLLDTTRQQHSSTSPLSSPSLQSPLPPSSPPLVPSSSPASSPSSTGHVSSLPLPPSFAGPPSLPDDTAPLAPRTSPSAYLRRRCPLCFGSNIRHNAGSMCVSVFCFATI